MKKVINIVILIFCFLSVQSQISPNKIIVIKNTYLNQVSDGKEELYESDTIALTNRRKIRKLVSKLSKIDSKKQLLNKFGIDSTYILTNTNELLKMYDGYHKDKIEWNIKQKDFIFDKLMDISTYRNQLDEYLSKGCCYTMHHSYRYEYVIILEKENEIVNKFISRKSIWGYHFPYIDQSNLSVYNFKIDKELNKLFKRKLKINKPLYGNELLKNIVNQIVERNMSDLYKLSPYSYKEEIKELTSDFEIISSEEVLGRGRYIWDEPKTMKITLKNEGMLSNVFMQFLCSKYDNVLYTRDSIKKDYKEIVNRIQLITFITDYLEQDSSAHLDIYYFNNSGINEYNIDSVNKNPDEWKKHDDYVKSLEWYNNNNIQPSFNIEETIKTSERNHCGCNYKFENDFIKKAIFFEIKSDRNPSSIWFLLPDETVLLYHVDSYQLEITKVIDRKIEGYSSSLKLPWACLRFDRKGKLIKKE